MLQAVSGIQAVDTDVEMPRGSMNGFELVRQIHAKRQEIGVLIASGRAAPKPGGFPDRALFIGKPVHRGTLVHLLRSLLGPRGDQSSGLAPWRDRCAWLFAE
jgi:CheY-like chemotaxis protein